MVFHALMVVEGVFFVWNGQYFIYRWRLMTAKD